MALEGMVRRTSPSSRSPRYPARWPLVPIWVTGLAAAGAVLASVAYLVGRHNAEPPTTTFGAMLMAVSSPGLAVFLTLAGLLLGAWSLRHLQLHWLAWRPGSIQVSEFTLGSPLTDANAEQLTMLFRRRLATLQIQSPTPMPGAAGASDFLDVLDRGSATARNPLGTLVALLRAARPTHAYEVRGVLLQRDGVEPYGIAIEVVRLPSEGLAATTSWGETWECALRRAADDATASILPQTRTCRAPWGVWRGYRMPGRLLHAYEEGTRLEHERRYDEALERYYEALNHDPVNAVLRLRIGQLQERLGLFIDAFATYSGICAGDRPRGVRRPRVMYRGTGRREQRRAQLSARYRRIVLLGGRVLAEQWRTVPSDPPTERDVQRERLRSCLRPKLMEELAPYVLAPKQLERLLQEPDRQDELATLRLRRVLARHALELSKPLRPRRDRRSTLTPATVRLTEVCIQARLAFVRNALGEDVPWPPKASDIDAQVSAIEHRLRGFRRWHEHYNAACAYALPLLDGAEDDHDDDPARAALAQAAVRRLEQANACADSAYIASRRDWLVSEDPDLRGLRARAEFAEFEVMQLPSSSITPRRPVAVQQLESSRYVRSLLLAASHQWQAVWRARREDLPAAPDVRLLLDWVADELRSWDAVRTVARHYRHSGSRLKLIHSLQEGAGRYGHAAPPVGFPRYELDPLEGARARRRCDDEAKHELENANDRLARLREIVHGRSQEQTARLAQDLERWRARLRHHQAEARPVDTRQVAQICDLHAAVWQQLGEWIEADEDSAAARERAFKQTVAKVRGHWRGWRALPGGGAQAAA
jgi:tetratricopeptide (TPR) repeat protein